METPLVVAACDFSHCDTVVDVGGEAEYAELLRRAGLRHTRTVPTAGPTSIVEAVAV